MPLMHELCARPACSYYPSQHVLATLYHLLGTTPAATLPDHTG